MQPLQLFHKSAQRALLCAATMLTCAALSAEHHDKSDKDTAFMKDAAKGGLMEVQMGKLGVEKGQNAEVKQFAQKLIDDHSKANDELKQLAQKKGVTLPTEVDHKAHKMMDRLQNASGADFDKAFARHGVMDHKKDIAKFEKASNEVKDAELKSFIQKTLPTLREHLQIAERLSKNLGVDLTVASPDDDADLEVSAKADADRAEVKAARASLSQ